MSLTLARLAEMARRDRDVAFTSIAHLIDIDMLRESHRRLRKDASAGVDGVTWERYDQNLEENLQVLHNRLRAKKYCALPVRRTHVPKDDGSKRPIGVPAHEDKIVQRAATTVLEAIYEQDFLPSSYGFRRGRSAHQALDACWRAIMDGNVNWVLDADVESFFDQLDRRWLLKFLQHRVKDRSLLRLIAKWLRAGVLEEGRWFDPETGSPQGSVISPLLANIFLHYALDLWVARVVKPRCRGRVHLYRYADDILLGFELKDDATRVAKVLPQRLGKFGLRLNEKKTHLIAFGQHAWAQWKHQGARKPASFNFLGFTHICASSLRGRFLVLRHTMAKRFRRSLRRIWEWCRDHLHLPAREQRLHLNLVLRGHYTYYGVAGNSRRINAFHRRVTRIWRSQRGHIPWASFNAFLRQYPLIPPRVTRAFPPPAYVGALA
jgi:group II intron reverse transcriptase/maturase